MHGLSLEVRNGNWVHIREGDDPDDRSPAQQTRDRLLRDLALAVHYDRIMPTQGEHVPARSGDAEPYASRADGNGKYTVAALSEAHAVLGDDAVVELLEAATHLAGTKPGQGALAWANLTRHPKAVILKNRAASIQFCLRRSQADPGGITACQ